MVWWCVLLWSWLWVARTCPPVTGGCYNFPPDDEINRPIDTDPIDYMSDCIVNAITGWNTGMLRLDLGVSVQDGYGFSLTFTNGSSMKPITYGTDGADYQDESDWYSAGGVLQNGNTAKPWAAPYMPWPQQTGIEGWKGTPQTDPSGGDRHIIVVDQVKCMLYESWYSVRLSSGFQVANTAIFNLSETLPQRPDYWTSSDAAGLPIFPLLLKYEELASGAINHAIRFTALRAQKAFTHPATHLGPYNDPTYPYYGARFRLKSSFDISGYSQQAQVFLTALKKYGLIFADQGTTAFVSGVSDPGFESLIDEVNVNKKISFANFEMVQSPFAIVRGYTAPNVTCNSVTSNPQNFVPNYTPNCPSNPTPHYFTTTVDPQQHGSAAIPLLSPWTLSFIITITITTLLF